jgi:peroxin-14
MHPLTLLFQRYVYPLVAPPTPERLQQDKKSIDEQFEKTFALVEQLSKDTEVLKAAEQQRTERLDTALSELETIITDLKASNSRRDDEAQRVRDDVQSLKDAVPQAISKSKDATDSRLKELNTELQSLKTLITQRMNQPPAPAATPKTITSNNSRPTTVTTPAPSTAAHTTPVPATANEHTELSVANAKPDEQKRPDYQDYASTLNRSSPFSSGAPPAKASIPAWQLAMAKKNNTGASSSPAAASSSTDAGASGSQESST